MQEVKIRDFSIKIGERLSYNNISIIGNHNKKLLSNIKNNTCEELTVIGRCDCASSSFLRA